MFLDRLKSLFRDSAASRVEEVNRLLEKVLSTDVSELAEAREQLKELLVLMEGEVKRVRSQAKGYPNATISGDVWFDGAALAGMEKFSQISYQKKTF